MTLIIPKNNFDSFKEFLNKKKFKFEDRPYQYFLARGKGVVVNLYDSGKIVFGGKDEKEINDIKIFLNSLEAEEIIRKENKYAPIVVSGKRIGTDEVGKGDYFGPLVIGGVCAYEAQIKLLKELGIKDSKKLSETTIQNYAVKIRQTLSIGQYSVITIRPIKYNYLQKKIGNLNGILGWGHSRAIENLLLKNSDCKIAIADQFGNQSYIERALMKHGKKIELLQTPRAEREITVAAASILARSELINRFKEMNEIFGLKFPKGATDVIKFAEEFVSIFGTKALLNVAKIHFKTTKQIRNVSLKLLMEENITEIELEKGTESIEEKIKYNISLECFNLIISFEQEFRNFIKTQLKNHFGSEWWEKGVKRDTIKSKALKLQKKEKDIGREVDLIDCLDWDNYRYIITDKNNWINIFQPIFKDESLFLARLNILKSVRNALAHARGDIKNENMLEIICSIKYINNFIIQE